MDNPDQKPKPTINAAHDKHQAAFTEACRGCDITGQCCGTILRFLEENNLVVYCKAKAYIFLSALDEEDELIDNLRSTRHCLRRADEQLKFAKELYVHDPKDAEILISLEKSIREEWDGLQVREKDYWSDDDENERSSSEDGY